MTDFPCLVRSVARSGEARHRLGDPLVDRYLEFVSDRARPNTLRAVAFDLKAFFMVVAKDPVAVAAGMCSSSWLISAGTAAWCGWRTGSRACRRGRSPAACHRCRACLRTWSPAATRRCRSTRCRAGCRPPSGRIADVADGAAGAGDAHPAEDPAACRGGPADPVREVSAGPSGRKKARSSLATCLGSSCAMKCPPRCGAFQRCLHDTVDQMITAQLPAIKPPSRRPRTRSPTSAPIWPATAPPSTPTATPKRSASGRLTSRHSGSGPSKT